MSSLENKALEKIRKILVADSTIKASVQDRVYTSHISNVERPVYPAISLHLVDSAADRAVPVMSRMIVQIDLWFPIKDFTSDDVLEVQHKIRELMHMQSLKDTSIGIKSLYVEESGIGPMMTDSASSCRHLPVRYRMAVV